VGLGFRVLGFVKGVVKGKSQLFISWPNFIGTCFTCMEEVGFCLPSHAQLELGCMKVSFSQNVDGALFVKHPNKLCILLHVEKI
jgi:hypothetical protein